MVCLGRRVSRARACLRVGAGLVTVAVAPENVPAISAGRPELICLQLTNTGVLAEAIEKAEVIAIGPGLQDAPSGRARRYMPCWRATSRSSSMLML